MPSTVPQARFLPFGLGDPIGRMTYVILNLDNKPRGNPREGNFAKLKQSETGCGIFGTDLLYLIAALEREISVPHIPEEGMAILSLTLIIFVELNF